MRDLTAIDVQLIPSVLVKKTNVYFFSSFFLFLHIVVDGKYGNLWNLCNNNCYLNTVFHVIYSKERQLLIKSIFD